MRKIRHAVDGKYNSIPVFSIGKRIDYFLFIMCVQDKAGNIIGTVVHRMIGAVATQGGQYDIQAD